MTSADPVRRTIAHPGRRATPLAAAAAATLVLLLTACALPKAPTYERPAAPVPTALPALPPLPVVAAAASAPAASSALRVGDLVASPWSWRQLLTEPRQQRLVELALANNRDLRAAVLVVERTRAQAEIVEADRLPTVGAGLNASRSPSPVTGKQGNAFSAGLQVSGWELDFFGRIANLSEAAKAQVLASAAGQRNTELALATAVIAVDLSLVADGQLLAITEATLASRRSALALTALREKVGAASALELQAAQSLVAQAEVALAQTRRQRQLDLNALQALVGAPVPAELLPAPIEPAPAGTAAAGGAAPTVTELRLPILPALPVLAAVPANLASEVLLERPDVLQAEQQLIGATANIGAARAAYWPRISLTGSAGLASNQLGNLLQAGSLAWTLAGQALVTVFDSGRIAAGVKVSELNRDIAITAYEKAVQTAFRETADGLAGLQGWREQVEAQERLRAATADTARLTALRHSRGAASELERLDAERNLLAADQALVATRLAEAQNRVALFKALGR
jgi:NodT family efflux transporter outer membrane factor (OMF) lipoprotein